MDNPRPDDSGSPGRDINNNDRNPEVPVPQERKTNEQEAGKNMRLLDDCLTIFSSMVMESANIDLNLESKNLPRIDADITCTLANDEDKSYKGPTEPKTEQGLEKPETPPSNKRENKESLNWVPRKWLEYKPRRLLLRDPSPNTSQPQSTADVGSSQSMYASKKRGNDGKSEYLNWAFQTLKESGTLGLPLEVPTPNTSQYPSTDQANPSGKQTTAEYSHAAIPQPSDVLVPPGSREKVLRMMMTLYWTGAP